MLKWKKFGTTTTLPRAGCPAKLINQGRRALVRHKMMMMVTLLSFREPVWRWEKGPEGQPPLQLSTSLDCMAEWADESLSSVKDTCLEFAKRTLIP
ncbi:hypothetical protein LDENG_00128550 [Lucifuga dentata]|nr:hypothetical protein LDENG_00128550 [Lucifuga dentata]